MSEQVMIRPLLSLYRGDDEDLEY